MCLHLNDVTMRGGVWADTIDTMRAKGVVRTADITRLQGNAEAFLPDRRPETGLYDAVGEGLLVQLSKNQARFVGEYLSGRREENPLRGVRNRLSGRAGRGPEFIEW